MAEWTLLLAVYEVPWAAVDLPIDFVGKRDARAPEYLHYGPREN